MEQSPSRRWIVAAPFALACTALWIYSAWVYEHVPHVLDLYGTVNHPVRRHQAESTAVYLFGYIGMATVCASVAVSSILGMATSPEDKPNRRFGMALIVMLIFGATAIMRIHLVRNLYGF